MRHFLIITFLLLVFGVNAQDDRAKQASLRFDDYEYVEAIDDYTELVEEGYETAEAYKDLAEASYHNARYDEAANWYSKLVEYSKGQIDAEYIFKYAQSLKSQGRYEESDKWMTTLYYVKKNDRRGQLFKADEDYLETIARNSDRVIIRNVSLNSKESDFAPSFYGKQLVFSTARDSGTVSRKIHVWNKKPFLNLYAAEKDDSEEFIKIKKLSRKLNSKAHESSTAFTKDGKTIYFTRNNFKRGTFARDEQGVSRLKIFKSTFSDNKWSKPQELPFNNDSYSVAHPSLSPDEKRLYFSSDMPGTIGKSDIWYVDVFDDGSYGEPVNLGREINTEARETFPYVSSQNILYFSSDGHPGLGGLDIFASKVLFQEDAPAVNLGGPINSLTDDFSYIVDEDLKEGYFASDRKGGNGGDDIYSFKEVYPLDFDNERVITVALDGLEKVKNINLSDFNLTNKDGEVVDKKIALVNGNLQLTVSAKEDNLQLFAELDGYEKVKLNLNTLNDSIKKLTFIPLDIDVLTVKPLYFDFDKSKVKPNPENTIAKVMRFLAENKKRKVKISSHTDSRGPKGYNQKLSDKRAWATKQYFMAQGIDESRLVAIGFGETQLVNECDDYTPCSREKHQENRRSEFSVILN